MQIIQIDVPVHLCRQLHSAEKDAGGGGQSVESPNPGDPFDVEDVETTKSDIDASSFHLSNLPNAATFYSQILDDVVERIKRGERVALLGTIQSRKSGVTDLQNMIIGLEKNFLLEHPLPKGTSIIDYRAEALLKCIYDDLCHIRGRNLIDYLRVIDSFESLLGGLIVGVLSERNSPLPEFSDFMTRLNLDSEFGRKTVAKMVGVAALCRAAKSYPENIEKIESGAEFTIGS
jgi:hypothetical protein